MVIEDRDLGFAIKARPIRHLQRNVLVVVKDCDCDGVQAVRRLDGHLCRSIALR